MFSLKEHKLIRGAVAHLRAGLGIGADYRAVINTHLFAPFDGDIYTFYGVQGGNWSKLIRANGEKIEFAHLDHYRIKHGKVKAGDLIAYTGNTGKITTGPHLHIQIFDKRGKRVDPELYNWGKDVYNENMENKSENKRILELTEQVRRLHAESRKLTLEVLEAKNELSQEQESNKETAEKLTACEKEREKIAGEGRTARTLLNRIRDFFT